MKKWRNTMMVTVYGAAVMGLAGAAQAACPRVADAAVSVQVIDPGPRVISTKSVAQITSMAGSHGLLRQGFKALGITRIQVDSAVHVDFQIQPSGAEQCVNVAKIAVRFGLKEHTVNVPREYGQGSCQYRFVLRHEMAHVDVNRRTMRKYALILKNEMRSALRQAGTIAAASAVEGQNAQTAVVQKVLDDVIARFYVEREALHADIDAPNSKYAAKGQCNGW